MSKKVKTLKGLKRGYVATLKTKIFNFGEGRHKYEVYELTGKGIDKPRYFVDEDSVRMFVTQTDNANKLEKEFTNAVKRASTKSERREMLAAKELAEMPIESKLMIDTAYSTFYKGGSIEVEKTTANSEDTDK